MKNIIKTAIVMLASLSIFASANAGELSVTGTAKATINSNGGNDTGKGLGVANEFDLTASGELDNGFTWKYQVQMDPNAKAQENDDSRLELTTPYGMLGIYSMEGGLDVEDGASQSVYGRPTDIGDPSGTTDNYTIDSYNNVQFHTPADLLPFSTVFKMAYAPTLDTTQNSANATGVTHTPTATNMGSSAMEYQLTLAPVDALAVKASFIEFQDAGSHTTYVGGVNNRQSPSSGALSAVYTIGATKVGASKALRDELLDAATFAGTEVRGYEQVNMSVSHLISDDLSVSYEVEKSGQIKVNGLAEVEQKSQSIQAAYTMGGMTLALVLADHSNNGYVENVDAKQTLLAVTMAF
jgi:hypothetical protein